MKNLVEELKVALVEGLSNTFPFKVGGVGIGDLFSGDNKKKWSELKKEIRKFGFKGKNGGEDYDWMVFASTLAVVSVKNRAPEIRAASEKVAAVQTDRIERIRKAAGFTEEGTIEESRGFVPASPSERAELKLKKLPDGSPPIRASFEKKGEEFMAYITGEGSQYRLFIMDEDDEIVFDENGSDMMDLIKKVAKMYGLRGFGG